MPGVREEPGGQPKLTAKQFQDWLAAKNKDQKAVGCAGCPRRREGRGGAPLARRPSGPASWRLWWLLYGARPPRNPQAAEQAAVKRKEDILAGRIPIEELTGARAVQLRRRSLGRALGC